jgi:hypothetical protein
MLRLIFYFASAALRHFLFAVRRSVWDGGHNPKENFTVPALTHTAQPAPPGRPPLGEVSYWFVASCACRRLALPYMLPAKFSCLVSISHSAAFLPAPF